MRKVNFKSKKNGYKEMFAVMGYCTVCSAVITAAIVAGYKKLEARIDRAENVLRDLWVRN